MPMNHKLMWVNFRSGKRREDKENYRIFMMKIFAYSSAYQSRNQPLN